ncbi:Caudovirales tail fiber assembly protein [compost metagenome]
MNSVYYSAELSGFYFEADKGLYEAVGSWPADALAISENSYQHLIEGQTQGHSIVPNEKGLPVLKAIEPDYPAIAEAQKQMLIGEAMQSVSVIQLKLQAGRALSELESSKLAAVLDHIDFLEKVDTESATSPVNWPSMPA